MIQITLNQILAKNPCSDGWAKILHARGKIDADQLAEFLEAGEVPSSYKKLADDEHFPLTMAFESNGRADVIWALRCLPEHSRLWRKFAVWSARQVKHLMKDQRSITALDVAWAHSEGLATDEQLEEARRAAAAYAAAYAAADATAYASATAYAAYAAADAAADATAYASATAYAAYAAAYASATAYADAMRKRQDEKLLKILDAGHWVEDEKCAE